MRSARVAQWILGLFLEPDRATAYTGDLVEEAAEFGSLWFWSSVVRLVVMRFWYDISESPLFLAGVLMRASVLNVAACMSMVVGSIILMTPVLMLLVGLLHAGLGVPSPRLDEPARWIGLVLGIAVIFLGAFFTGRWIATKMPHREVIACIAMCVAQPLLYSLLGFVVIQFRGVRFEHYLLTHVKPSQTSYSTLPDPLNWLLTGGGFLVGGLRARLRSAPQ